MHFVPRVLPECVGKTRTSLIKTPALLKTLSTPNMDRIGHEGFTFHNALVVNSPCLPSRATFLTGQYSHTTGAVSNVEGTIPSQFKLISDMFHAAGYETAFIGKSHIKVPSKITTGITTSALWDKPITTAPC